MKDETVRLITGIYEIFERENPPMLDAYIAAMSIAASIAANNGVTEEEFIRDCKDSFADGKAVSITKFTIN
jgi:hypothetical protein